MAVVGVGKVGVIDGLGFGTADQTFHSYGLDQGTGGQGGGELP
jgi:hypothetical protein